MNVEIFKINKNLLEKLSELLNETEKVKNAWQQKVSIFSF